MHQVNHPLHFPTPPPYNLRGVKRKGAPVKGPSRPRSRIAVALRPPNRWQRRSDRPLTHVQKFLDASGPVRVISHFCKTQKKLVTSPVTLKPSRLIRPGALKSSKRSNSHPPHPDAKSCATTLPLLEIPEVLGPDENAAAGQIAGIGTLSIRDAHVSTSGQNKPQIEVNPQGRFATVPAGHRYSSRKPRLGSGL